MLGKNKHQLILTERVQITFCLTMGKVYGENKQRKLLGKINGEKSKT